MKAVLISAENWMRLEEKNSSPSPNFQFVIWVKTDSSTAVGALLGYGWPSGCHQTWLNARLLLLSDPVQVTEQFLIRHCQRRKRQGPSREKPFQPQVRLYAQQ